MSLTKKIIIALIAGLVVGLSLNAFLSEEAFSTIDYYVLSGRGYLSTSDLDARRSARVLLPRLRGSEHE